MPLDKAIYLEIFRESIILQLSCFKEAQITLEAFYSFIVLSVILLSETLVCFKPKLSRRRGGPLFIGIMNVLHGAVVIVKQC